MQIRLAPGQRQRLMWERQTVSIVLNEPAGDLLYGVVTSSFDYPERLVYKLLEELGEVLEDPNDPTACDEAGKRWCLVVRSSPRYENIVI